MSFSSQKALPYHVGFIVDGNRRLAREKGLPAFIGYKKGSFLFNEAFWRFCYFEDD